MSRESIREALGIGSGETVALVLYESQTEHIWRASCLELCARYNTLLLLPLGDKARDNFIRTWMGQASNLKLVDSLGVEEAADEIVAFRVNEDLLTGRKVVVRVLDPVNRWQSAELAA